MTNKPDDDQYKDEFIDDTYETEETSPDNGENSGEWDDTDYSDDPDAGLDNDAQDASAHKKKKSNLSTIIIIAVAVIGSLGFLVFKFGGESAPVPSEQPAEQAEVAEAPSQEDSAGNVDNTAAPITTPTTPENVVDTTPDTQGFMMAPEKVENIVIKKPEPPPVEKPITDTPPAEPPPIGFPEDTTGAPGSNAPEGKGNEVAATPQLATGDAPPAEFPTVANILKPQPDIKETPSDTSSAPENTSDIMAPQPEMPTPAPMAVTPVDNNTVQQAVESPTDVKKSPAFLELADNLNLANQKIAELEAKITAQEKMPAAEIADNSGEIAALHDKIASLESKLQAKTMADKHKVSAVRATAKKVPNVARPAPQVRWSLRGASPGKAILYNEIANETKTVRVGDRIAAIGTITSIEKMSGNWVVQGTSGEISR